MRFKAVKGDIYLCCWERYFNTYHSAHLPVITALGHIWQHLLEIGIDLMEAGNLSVGLYIVYVMSGTIQHLQTFCCGFSLLAVHSVGCHMGSRAVNLLLPEQSQWNGHLYESVVFVLLLSGLLFQVGILTQIRYKIKAQSRPGSSIASIEKMPVQSDNSKISARPYLATQSLHPYTNQIKQPILSKWAVFPIAMSQQICQKIICLLVTPQKS